MRHLYFDHQSTTPVHPEVWAAMQPFFSDAFGNPASIHHRGLEARDALQQARAQVARLIQARSPDEILFTSSATEAANLAVKGVADAYREHGQHLVVSAVEHPAVLESVRFLERQGFECTRVGVDAEGVVDPEAVRAALTDRTILVAVHHVNHEIGTVEPIREISELTRARGIPFFVDAVASGGWRPVRVPELGASLVSLSPHRFYGPKGVGILYRQRPVRLTPLVHGGAQEGGRRAGTENLPGLVGAGAACALAERELDARQAHTARLQQRLWEGIQASVPSLRLNGPPLGSRRSTTNLHWSVEGVEGEAQLLRCDLAGLQVASGPACLGAADQPSSVLKAIGLSPVLARGSLLVSLGQEHTEADIDDFVSRYAAIVAALRALSPSWAALHVER